MSGQRPLPRILSGQHEPIFSVLPGNVLQNLHHPNSENAVLWNRIYPLVLRGLSLRSLLRIRPLWGVEPDGVEAGSLSAYFWGYSPAGENAPGLVPALAAVDGPGPRTEVDLILIGPKDLVLVEAKHTAHFGRCGRFGRGRCPELQLEGAEGSCRYWQDGPTCFDRLLDWQGPPDLDPHPQCNRHYQLGRTLLLAEAMGTHLGLRPHLWLIVPARRWQALEKDWLDFVDSIKDDQLWRRLRVISWEGLAQTAPP